LQAREDRRKEEVRQAELLRIRAQERIRRSEAALTVQCSAQKWLAKMALNNIKNPKKVGGKDKGEKKVVCTQSNKAQLCDILLNFIAFGERPGL
jgi:hypothetical protein